jgi:RecJ-like exonuclease
MKTINFEDIKYFLKQKVIDQIAYMGVFEDLGDKVKVCMMSDFGNVKKGEVAIVDKSTIVERCKEGSCEIISPDEYRENHELYLSKMRQSRAQENRLFVSCLGYLS